MTFKRFLVKSVYNHEFYLGSFMFIASILLLILKIKEINALLTLSLGVNWISLLLLVDWLNRRINKISFYPITQNRKNTFKKIIFGSLIFCIILDLYGVFFSRLWFYPFWDFKTYILLAPLAFIVYTLILFNLYILIKNNLDKWARRGRPSQFQNDIYNTIVRIDLVVGIMMILISIIYSFKHINKFSIDFFEVNKSTNLEVPFWFIVFPLIGFFFIFEYLCFKQGKETLTRDILRLNLIPSLSILIATALALLFIEITNSPFQVWVFDNWSFNDVALGNIPLMAFLAWPFQFLTFLSILRYLIEEKKIDIW